LDFGLEMLGHFAFFLIILVGLLAQVEVVVLQVPLFERGGIDLDDTVFDQSFGTDQLVVGGVINDIDDLGLAGDTFGGPVKVTFVQA